MRRSRAARSATWRHSTLHSTERRIARTQGGGLTLTQDGDDILLAAELPATRDADDTIALVRAGVLRGFSIEFHAETDEWLGDLRTVTRAGLPSIGVVDRPAFASAQGIELRRSLANPADTGGVQLSARMRPGCSNGWEIWKWTTGS